MKKLYKFYLGSKQENPIWYIDFFKKKKKKEEFRNEIVTIIENKKIEWEDVIKI